MFNYLISFRDYKFKILVFYIYSIWNTDDISFYYDFFTAILLDGLNSILDLIQYTSR